MHEGQVIATQRLGKLPKKATHCHPIDENCTHLVTQLSYTQEVSYRDVGRENGGQGAGGEKNHPVRYNIIKAT